jgi:hypothetical protein
VSSFPLEVYEGGAVLSSSFICFLRVVPIQPEADPHGEALVSVTDAVNREAESVAEVKHDDDDPVTPESMAIDATNHEPLAKAMLSHLGPALEEQNRELSRKFAAAKEATAESAAAWRDVTVELFLEGRARLRNSVRQFHTFTMKVYLDACDLQRDVNDTVREYKPRVIVSVIAGSIVKFGEALLKVL